MYKNVVYSKIVKNDASQKQKNMGYFANTISDCYFKNRQLCEKLPSPMGESAVDCSTVSSMPSVSFTIGGKTFSLKAEEVTFSLHFMLFWLIMYFMFDMIKKLKQYIVWVVVCSTY